MIDADLRRTIKITKLPKKLQSDSGIFRHEIAKPKELVKSAVGTILLKSGHVESWVSSRWPMSFVTFVIPVTEFMLSPTKTKFI